MGFGGGVGGEGRKQESDGKEWAREGERGGSSLGVGWGGGDRVGRREGGEIGKEEEGQGGVSIRSAC